MDVTAADTTCFDLHTNVVIGELLEWEQRSISLAFWFDCASDTDRALVEGGTVVGGIDLETGSFLWVDFSDIIEMLVFRKADQDAVRVSTGKVWIAKVYLRRSL